MSTDINEFIKILQISISPAVLISGVGLLVLSLVNRFAHTLDRARILTKENRDMGEDRKRYIKEQIRILYKRTWLLLIAICFALASIFLLSILIATLFIIFTIGGSYVAVVMSLFIASIACLILSLLFFIFDMSLSLKAFRKDIARIA